MTVDLIYLLGIRFITLFLRQPTIECKRKIHSDEGNERERRRRRDQWREREKGKQIKTKQALLWKKNRIVGRTISIIWSSVWITPFFCWIKKNKCAISKWCLHHNRSLTEEHFYGFHMRFRLFIHRKCSHSNCHWPQSIQSPQKLSFLLHSKCVRDICCEVHSMRAIQHSRFPSKIALEWIEPMRKRRKRCRNKTNRKWMEWEKMWKQLSWYHILFTPTATYNVSTHSTELNRLQICDPNCWKLKNDKRREIERKKMNTMFWFPLNN